MPQSSTCNACVSCGNELHCRMYLRAVSSNWTTGEVATLMAIAAFRRLELFGYPVGSATKDLMERAFDLLVFFPVPCALKFDSNH